MDLDVGEAVLVEGGPATVIYEQKSGRKVRLRIVADKAVKLRRQSVVAP